MIHGKNSWQKWLNNLFGLYLKREQPHISVTKTLDTTPRSKHLFFQPTVEALPISFSAFGLKLWLIALKAIAIIRLCFLLKIRLLDRSLPCLSEETLRTCLTVGLRFAVLISQTIFWTYHKFPVRKFESNVKYHPQLPVKARKQNSETNSKPL